MRKTERNLRKSYKTYKESNDSPVGLKDYLLISAEYNKFLMSKILEGNEITLPSKLGTLMVTGRTVVIKMNDEGLPNLAPNWKETKKLRDENENADKDRKVVYLLNSHSSGVRFKLSWSKNRVFLENKSFYSMRLTRDNKRAISNSIKNGKEYYIKY